MRVLLDEHLPIGFAPALEGHEVSTVRGEGWMGLSNGALLQAASSADFEVFVTNDRSIEHQQNLDTVGLGIVVLDAPSNKLPDLLVLAHGVLEAIAAVNKGQVLHVAG
ncbi:MAG: DUF5615 family PIN-like protein [Actinobacteria bacterium]|nr:DUF5615 family PIN-like protein [Actinomycetota bacterium]